uniref:SHUGOSHIN 2-like n=1 Tax=Steinernema glaseri TaxID=37863 RepID=A0A1I8AGK8_9BILA
MVTKDTALTTVPQYADLLHSPPPHRTQKPQNNNRCCFVHSQSRSIAVSLLRAMSGKCPRMEADAQPSRAESPESETDHDAKKSETPPQGCARCSNYKTNALMAYKCAQKAQQNLVRLNEIENENGQLQKINIEQRSYIEDLLQKNQQLEREKSEATLFLRDTDRSYKELLDKYNSVSMSLKEAQQGVNTANEWKQKFEEAKKALAEVAQKRISLIEKYKHSVHLLQKELNRQKVTQRKLDESMEHIKGLNKVISSGSYLARAVKALFVEIETIDSVPKNVEKKIAAVTGRIEQFEKLREAEKHPERAASELTDSLSASVADLDGSIDAAPEQSTQRRVTRVPRGRRARKSTEESVASSSVVENFANEPANIIANDHQSTAMPGDADSGCESPPQNAVSESVIAPMEVSHNEAPDSVAPEIIPEVNRVTTRRSLRNRKVEVPAQEVPVQMSPPESLPKRRGRKNNKVPPQPVESTSNVADTIADREAHIENSLAASSTSSLVETNPVPEDATRKINLGTARPTRKAAKKSISTAVPLLPDHSVAKKAKPSEIKESLDSTCKTSLGNDLNQVEEKTAEIAEGAKSADLVQEAAPVTVVSPRKTNRRVNARSPAKQTRMTGQKPFSTVIPRLEYRMLEREKDQNAELKESSDTVQNKSLDKKEQQVEAQSSEHAAESPKTTEVVQDVEPEAEDMPDLAEFTSISKPVQKPLILPFRKRKVGKIVEQKSEAKDSKLKESSDERHNRVEEKGAEIAENQITPEVVQDDATAVVSPDETELTTINIVEPTVSEENNGTAEISTSEVIAEQLAAKPVVLEEPTTCPKDKKESKDSTQDAPSAEVSVKVSQEAESAVQPEEVPSSSVEPAEQTNLHESEEAACAIEKVSENQNVEHQADSVEQGPGDLAEPKQMEANEEPGKDKKHVDESQESETARQQTSKTKEAETAVAIGEDEKQDKTKESVQPVNVVAESSLQDKKVKDVQKPPEQPTTEEKGVTNTTPKKKAFVSSFSLSALLDNDYPRPKASEKYVLAQQPCSSSAEPKSASVLNAEKSPVVSEEKTTKETSSTPVEQTQSVIVSAVSVQETTVVEAVSSGGKKPEETSKAAEEAVQEKSVAIDLRKYVDPDEEKSLKTEKAEKEHKKEKKPLAGLTVEKKEPKKAKNEPKEKKKDPKEKKEKPKEKAEEKKKRKEKKEQTKAVEPPSTNADVTDFEDNLVIDLDSPMQSPTRSSTQNTSIKLQSTPATEIKNDSLLVLDSASDSECGLMIDEESDSSPIKSPKRPSVTESQRKLLQPHKTEEQKESKPRDVLSLLDDDDDGDSMLNLVIDEPEDEAEEVQNQPPPAKKARVSRKADRKPADAVVSLDFVNSLSTEDILSFMEKLRPTSPIPPLPMMSFTKTMTKRVTRASASRPQAAKEPKQVVPPAPKPTETQDLSVLYPIMKKPRKQRVVNEPVKRGQKRKAVPDAPKEESTQPKESSQAVVKAPQTAAKPQPTRAAEPVKASGSAVAPIPAGPIIIPAQKRTRGRPRKQPLPEEPMRITKQPTAVHDHPAILDILQYTVESTGGADPGKLQTKMQPFRETLPPDSAPSLAEGIVKIALRMEVGDLRGMLLKATKDHARNGRSVVLGSPETSMFEFINQLMSFEGMNKICELIFANLLLECRRIRHPTSIQFSKFVRCLSFSYVLATKTNPACHQNLHKNLAAFFNDLLMSSSPDITVPAFCYALTIVPEVVKDLVLNPEKPFENNLFNLHLATRGDFTLVLDLATIYVGQQGQELLTRRTAADSLALHNQLLTDSINNAVEVEWKEDKCLISRATSTAFRKCCALFMPSLSFAQGINRNDVIHQMLIQSDTNMTEFSQNPRNVSLIRMAYRRLLLSARLVVVYGSCSTNKMNELQHLMTEVLKPYTRKMRIYLGFFKSSNPKITMALQHWFKSIQPFSKHNMLPTRAS